MPKIKKQGQFMSTERYPVGTVIRLNEMDGVVVDNVKLPGDICVEWIEHPGMITSYDDEYLDRHNEIISE